MQTKSGPLDDLTNLMANAVGAVKGVGDEMKAVGRSQAEKMVADLDLVTREELEVVKSMIGKVMEENESLKQRLVALEKTIKSKSK